MLACGSSARDSISSSRSANADWFVDRAADAGLRFIHFNGMSGGHYFPEVMPPGVGLFDFDNDGGLDVSAVQGPMLAAGKPVDQAISKPTGPAGGRLFRNDVTANADGTRTLHFVDVTDRSGIHATEYGIGVAAGDMDNDGWVDLYLKI